MIARAEITCFASGEFVGSETHCFVAMDRAETRDIKIHVPGLATVQPCELPPAEPQPRRHICAQLATLLGTEKKGDV